MVAEGPGAGSAGRAPIVFLSYSRADKAQAVRLAKALQGAGLDVWWDTLIEGGAEFAKTIEAAINTCDAVVVAWSQASVSSDWVLDEAARGRELHKLVPVSLDGTEPPMGFRRYHSIDLQGGRATQAPPRSTPSFVAWPHSPGVCRRRLRLRPWAPWRSQGPCRAGDC